jgi:hypothetical protein
MIELVENQILIDLLEMMNLLILEIFMMMKFWRLISGLMLMVLPLLIVLKKLILIDIF